MTDAQEFATMLTALAGMVPNCTLNKEAVGLYREAAARVGYQKCSMALKQLMAERSSKDPFPSIAEMLERANGNSLDADEVAGRISGAVSKYGAYRGDEARAYLGDVGWEVVRIEGGWESVCRALTYENMTTFQAQWRKIAAAVIRNRSTGRLRETGFLPVGDAVKQITGDLGSKKEG